MKQIDLKESMEKLQANAQAFARFRALLLEYNAKFNLTAITGEEEVTYKHFLDSVAGEGWFKEGAKVCEIGSGAGFPSIPLKIVRPDLSFTLIESREKKCSFLRIAAEELALSDITVLCTRAEEGARRADLREKFDVVCARAVAEMNTLAEYCLPFVRVGGYMIAYKGKAEGELQRAKRAIALLGGETEEAVSYSLPKGYGERMLIAVKKVKRTPEKYPRGQGKERGDPL